MSDANKTKKQTPKGQQLNREQIVDVALALVDRRGAEKFSLREVARELDVYPTAVYWHIKGGRNELLGAVVERALEGVTPPLGLGDNWQDWLRQLFYRYRQALSSHPNVAPLLGAQMVSNAGVSPILVERMLTVLEAAGFRDKALVDSYNACLASLLGYVTLEFAPAPSYKAEDWCSDLQTRLTTLSEEHYPHIVKNLGQMSNRAFVLRWQSGDEIPLDGGFEAYVDTFIRGLADRAELLA